MEGKRLMSDVLRCPACGSNLAWGDGGPDGRTEASVRCLGCAAVYACRNGMVNLMVNPSESVQREAEGLRRLEERILAEHGEPDADTIETLPWRYRIARPASYWSSPYWVVNTANFDALLDALQLQRGERVLDLGAGIGWTSTRLARAGCEVLAVDISSTRLTGLRGGEFFFREGPSFDRAVFDMSAALPVKNECIDTVVASAALHHSRSLLQTLREIHRVLRRGGRLAVVNEATQGWFRDASRFGEDVVDLEGEENVYTYRDWVKRLRRAGFQRWRLLFPRNLEMDFAGAVTFGTSFILVRKLARACWELPALRWAVKRFALIPAHVLFGTQLSFIATKDS